MALTVATHGHALVTKAVDGSAHTHCSAVQVPISLYRLVVSKQFKILQAGNLGCPWKVKHRLGADRTHDSASLLLHPGSRVLQEVVQGLPRTLNCKTPSHLALCVRVLSSSTTLQNSISMRTAPPESYKAHRFPASTFPRLHWKCYLHLR